MSDDRTWLLCMVCGHEQPETDEPGCGACDRGEPVFVRPRAPTKEPIRTRSAQGLMDALNRRKGG